ncbi:sensor histidine kinase [Pseudonocardia sp. TRM90224]|uniref:sensor histidine kinase n=1 Tax=Pseudonocardia sp. TRM90224 TaxID=2812678 RepID=UPI001E466C8F|nr:sensor histidine kinase [Pseudonocardia sp. TRM90224]
MDIAAVRSRLRPAWYLALSLPIAAAAAVSMFLLVATAATTAAAGLGLLLLPFALSALRRFTDTQRRRAAALLGEPVEPRYRPLPAGAGARLRHVFRDPTTARDVGWLVVAVLTGLPLGAIGLFALAGVPVAVVQTALWWLASPEQPVTLLGIPVRGWGTALAAGAAQLAICLAVLRWVLPPLARGHALLTRAVLTPAPTGDLQERVTQLTATRAGALSAHAAELQRIERDLHDGAQARLVALAIRLGVAERSLADDPETAARLLREARTGAEDAMAELRDVARTIYPPILADRGLAGAVAALAARCPVPTRIDAGELGELPAAVETAAYFVIAEGLTNIAKYSDSEHAEVLLLHLDDRLLVSVTDDGRGGVDETRGTGVVGIRRRVAALDGTTAVSSPPGGPTTIAVELPCGS